MTSDRDLNWSGFTLESQKQLQLRSSLHVSNGVNGNVIEHAAVNKNHPVQLDRRKYSGKDMVARIAVDNEPLSNTTESPLTRSVATQRNGIGS